MRILLIDDHPIVRSACRRLLQTNGEVEVAEAATAANGLSAAGWFLPDIIILDLNLPDGHGLDLLQQMLSEDRDRKVIVFSMYDDPVFAARALEAGAKGYMTKSDAPEDLLRAIAKVKAGGIFLTGPMAEKLALKVAAARDGFQAELSSRERRVLELLSVGRTLAQVADELEVSYRTSAHIVSQIKIKLHITSTAALIRWAVENTRLPTEVR
jgi:two-component system invasion response regulator UvrY